MVDSTTTTTTTTTYVIPVDATLPQVLAAVNEGKLELDVAVEWALNTPFNLDDVPELYGVLDIPTIKQISHKQGEFIKRQAAKAVEAAMAVRRTGVCAVSSREQWLKGATTLTAGDLFGYTTLLAPDEFSTGTLGYYASDKVERSESLPVLAADGTIAVDDQGQEIWEDVTCKYQCSLSAYLVNSKELPGFDAAKFAARKAAKAAAKAAKKS